MYREKSRERLMVEALEAIFGRTMKVIISNGEIIQWLEPIDVQPSTEQIQQKMDEILHEEPNRLLREERDQRLAACDWRMTVDYPGEDQEQWILYRQRLRDLPNRVANGEITKPSINEYGLLVFEDWPIPPNVT